MNEKIKELIKQATIVGEPGYPESKFKYFDKEKFAELIVNECISVVRADGDHWEQLSRNPPRGQEHFRDHMLYSAYRLKEDAVWSIQEHFGVEE
jgi:hypothetical protein